MGVLGGYFCFLSSVCDAVGAARRAGPYAQGRRPCIILRPVAVRSRNFVHLT